MLACTLCHNRKVRCVAADNPPSTCTTCMTAGVECIPRTRKRRRLNSSVDAVRDGQETSPSQRSQPHENVASGANKNRDTSILNLPHQLPQSNTYIGRSHYISQDEDIDEASARAFGPAKVGPHLSTQQATMKLWKSFDVPPHAARQSLLSAFLDHCNIWTPVLETRDVEELSQVDIHRGSMLLAQSLWLAGSRITSAPSVVAFASSDDFYHRAKAVFWSGVETDPISAIKASLMLQWYNPQAPEHVSFDNSGFWLKIGLGIAHQIGLHKQCPPGPYRAIRKKLWWSLVARDALITVAHGRPRVIDLDDSDVAPPTQNDFGESLSACQLFSSWVNICVVLGDIATCYMRKHMSRIKRSYIENALHRWTRCLPPTLRVAPNDQPSSSYFPSSNNFAARQLYLPYFTGLIMFSRMQNPNGSMSLTATLAASFVSRIFEDFLARDEIKVLAPIFTRYCLIASMALVAIMSHRQLWEAAQPDLTTLQLSLTELSKRWRSAIGASKVLQNVITKRKQSLHSLVISEERALEYFDTLDLNYCRMWHVLSQNISATGLTVPPELQMSQMHMQSSNEVGATEPFIPSVEEYDMNMLQFEHVENWILNDGFFFEP